MRRSVRTEAGADMPWARAPLLLQALDADDDAGVYVRVP
jgi:hypothetical protein